MLIQNEQSIREPNYTLAGTWWTDLPDIWTPIGWKDHLFRFNVLWNGTICAEPCLNRRTEAWKGQGIQLAFVPSIGEGYPGRWPVCHTRDDGMVMQGWNDGAAPVLWSEWSNAGLLLRQDVFAHIPGGRPVETGIEPLFAWVRLSVREACTALPLEESESFLISINAPHVRYTMSKFAEHLDPSTATYPRTLAAPDAYAPETGFMVMDGDKVRLAIAPGQSCTAKLLPPVDDNPDPLLVLRLPAVAGAYVDLLLPMLPTEPEVFARELALGYDGALAEAERFWSVTLPTAATVDVPEAPLNELLRRSLQFGEVVAEKNPADGQYALLTGSLHYANMWATPMAMTAIMMLDTLGYHDSVEKYLEVFHKEQGTVVPPGDSYTLHPGYLSSPKSLTSIDWLSDHGALLYAIAEHALLSGDRAFAERWLETIIRACDFTCASRRRTDHPGVPGILPPAVATDRGTQIQGVWNDGWHYKGLTAAIKLLRQLGHPRAEKFAAEAAEYKAAYQAAYRAKATTQPTWTDAQGREHILAPTAMFGNAPSEVRHAFYLDTGPLFLVYAGLLPADDPLMQSTLHWFREGPQTAFKRHDACCFQIPFLDHEISNCEPCYSWNVFHTWQLGDRERYLEGMYSLFTGIISRKTFTYAETRGGVTGITPALLPVWLMRLAVIDDQLVDGELHLLRLLPLAWLSHERETVFDDMPTEYGPVSLRVRLSEDGTTLMVMFTPRFRQAPSKVMLHLPPVPGLRAVTVNGNDVPFIGGEPILLTVAQHSIAIG